MKNKISIVLFVTLLMVSLSGNIWAQFAVPYQPGLDSIKTTPDLSTDKPDEMTAQFAGNTMMTLGKTLTVAGFFTYLTPGYMTIISMGNQHMNPKQQSVVKTMAYVTSAAVLVGIPLWIIGKSIEKNPKGEQYLGNPKGFGMRVDVAANVSPMIGADCIAGYHFGPYLFVGGGIGSRFVDGLSVPVFADVRATYSQKRVAPFIGFKAGGSYHSSYAEKKNQGIDAFFSLNLGVRIRHKYNNRSSGDWWIGGVTESSHTIGTNTGLQVSYSF